jgi:hypothetical protein
MEPPPTCLREETKGVEIEECRIKKRERRVGKSDVGNCLKAQ